VKDAVKLQGEVVPYLHNLFSVRMRYAAKRYMKLVERQRERETEREREGGRERERGRKKKTFYTPISLSSAHVDLCWPPIIRG
jgi:hypothetical protein